MIPLVDIGNSRVKLGRWENGCVTGLRAYTQTEFWDGSKIPLFNIPDIDRVIACNVAGHAYRDRLSDICERRGVPIEWFTSTHPIADLAHCYDRPDELGDDRWLAMAGARHHYTGGLIVVDCGTATTIDIVDADGGHRGGAILPGIATMRRALESNTSDLRIDDANESVRVFNCNTEDAIAGGTLYALAAAIDRFAAEARALHGAGLQTILCGGEAEIVMPLLQQKCVLDTTLVLMGLAFAAGLQ